MEHLRSRSILVDGKRTSIRLEGSMWVSLKDIAQREKTDVHTICTTISQFKNPKTTLTSKIRIFIMLYYKAATTEEGHTRAGHGDFKEAINRTKNSVNKIEKLRQGEYH